MADIRPFKGIVFNRTIIRNLSKVMSPPYDIISKKEQDDLYRADRNNIVRLELGKMKKADDDVDNRYSRAGKFFESWLKNKIMVRDEKESIYIYSQTYKDGGKIIDRVGFVALMALDEGKKKVLPHENTLLAPKTDRLNLIRRVKANLSPIFILYDDASHRVLKILNDTCRKKKPFIDVRFEGIRNRAWRLDDELAIKKIQFAMRNADTFIADGHHRFEVSRTYYREAVDSGAPEAMKRQCGYVMVYFVESKEDMLTVLPAHRLPRDAGNLSKGEAMSRLKEFFAVKECAGLGAMMGELKKSRNNHAFGFYAGLDKYYVLMPKDMHPIDRALKGKPKEWRRLDVAILHLFIFKHVLDIGDEDDNIEFVKDEHEAAELVDKKRFKMAFFLNPTKVAQIKRIASLGEKMPRKATYFYPKPLSGIVINKLD